LKNLKLEKSPVHQVKSNKIDSIQTVLFAVPSEHRSYYPKNDKDDDDISEHSDSVQRSQSAVKAPRKSTTKRIRRTFNPTPNRKSTKTLPPDSIMKFLVNKPSSTPTAALINSKSNVLTEDRDLNEFEDVLMTPPSHKNKSVSSTYLENSGGSSIPSVSIPVTTKGQLIIIEDQFGNRRKTIQFD
jgi:hypothetical protein